MFPKSPPLPRMFGRMGGEGAPRIFPWSPKYFMTSLLRPPLWEHHKGGVSSNSSSTLLRAVAPSSPPPCGCSLCSDVSRILRISPKSGSTKMGCILLDVHEQHHKAPILAYFTSTGHEVVPFPCPDFDTFLHANYLCMWDVSFVGNLPDYIIPTG